MKVFVEYNLDYIDGSSEKNYGEIVGDVDELDNQVSYKIKTVGEKYLRKRYPFDLRVLNKEEIVKLKLKGEL